MKAPTQKMCDRLLQEIVRKENEKCLLCNNPCEVAHHYIRKSLSSFLRYDFRNLIPLCNKCHCKHHLQEDPAFDVQILDIKGRAWYDEIERDRRKYNKVNAEFYKRIYQELTKRLND
jgi:5-methylcytosine-specific restriction endonuclease McrA